MKWPKAAIQTPIFTHTSITESKHGRANIKTHSELATVTTEQEMRRGSG